VADRNVNSVRWHWLVNVLAASPAVGRERRSRLLARAGVDVGKALVEPGCFFFGADVHLGEWTWVNHRVYFDSRDRIDIGAFCSIAMEVMFCTSTHAMGGPEKRAGEYRSAPIRVGDGTWIGTRAVVMPGVTIAPSCVIGAGAIVTKDTEPNGLYAGVPAKRIKDLDG
jgi:maltose O-acetyltransferase